MAVAPSTRVLTSAFQWERVSKVRRGHELVCLDASGRFWDIARVLFIEEVREPAWKLELAWDYKLECTGEQLVYVMTKEGMTDSPTEGTWVAADDLLAKDYLPLTFIGNPWKKGSYGAWTPQDDPQRVAGVAEAVLVGDDLKGERMVTNWLKERREFDLDALPPRANRGVLTAPSPFPLPLTERALMAYSKVRAVPQEDAPRVTKSKKKRRMKALEVVTTAGTVIGEGFALKCRPAWTAWLEKHVSS